MSNVKKSNLEQFAQKRAAEPKTIDYSGIKITKVGVIPAKNLVSVNERFNIKDIVLQMEPQTEVTIPFSIKTYKQTNGFPAAGRKFQPGSKWTRHVFQDDDGKKVATVLRRIK